MSVCVHEFMGNMKSCAVREGFYCPEGVWGLILHIFMGRIGMKWVLDVFSDSDMEVGDETEQV